MGFRVWSLFRYAVLSVLSIFSFLFNNQGRENWLLDSACVRACVRVCSLSLPSVDWYVVCDCGIS